MPNGNRLASEASPYLRQHADNPVHWYPWGEEAFAEARRRDVPVLLSVGYSSCHWCHVMAHESFEDPETAAEMNRLFVNVKVDREERPDVDAIYMEALQAMTGRGGWPMTVWLTPEGRPFYAGTYFPDSDRHGMPSFRRVMAAVAEAWSERREEVVEQAGRLAATIDRSIPPAERPPGAEELGRAHEALEREYDPVNGGFGGAPKFPQAPVLEFLLRANGRPWAPRAGAMAGQTLRRMAAGGIHDQVGGGFARYSVDAEWLVPHFEKMLYDNAQLARLYLRAWQALGDPSFREVAERTLGYLLRDLRHPDGGFYSAEDADSEGEEGRFYVWTREELVEAAGEDAAVAEDWFGVSEHGNFEGRNVLHQARSVNEVAEAQGLTAAGVRGAVARATERLFEARLRRVRPGLDDKVVAAWNGLALRAFAEAGAVLGSPAYLEAARACAGFLLDSLRTSDGRMLRSWTDGHPGPGGFLDDHAGVALGLFALYQATGELRWYEEAERLTRLLPRLFADPAGGFYATPADGERLIKRPKDLMDNPTPSGSSLAAEALLTLALYTADADMRALAVETIRAGGLLAAHQPSAVGHLLAVAASLERGTKEVAVVGPEAEAVVAAVWEGFHPEVVVAVDVDGSDEERVPLLRHRFREGRTLAYVCRDLACEAPVTDREALRRALAV